MQYYHPTLAFKSLIPLHPTSYQLPLYPHHHIMLLAVFPYLLLPLSSLNSSGFFNGKLEISEQGALNYFILSHPVDVICNQISNLNSSSSLQSDRTHSQCGILSPNTTHASGGVIIFVWQGLSFFELSTSSLSLLDPYSDYIGINISLNNSSSLSFLNVYAPPICSSPMDSRTDSFSFSIFSSCRNLFNLGDFNCHQSLSESRGASDPRGDVSDWFISSDLFPINEPDIPAPFHLSSGSRSSPDVSFAPSFLALSCF